MKNLNSSMRGPIDVVYTIADTSAPIFYEQLHEIQKSFSKAEAESDSSSRRYNDLGQLRFSLRSLAEHFHEIRDVIIVTNNSVPDWVAKNVKVVKHSEIFPFGQTYLPNFSACAIESCLHRIPNLSEWFLYLNDDSLLLDDVTLDDFMREKTVLYYVEAIDFLDFIGSSKAAWPASVSRTFDFIERTWERIGRKRLLSKTPRLWHVPTLYGLEKVFAKEFHESRTSRIRSEVSFNIPYLFAYGTLLDSRLPRSKKILPFEFNAELVEGDSSAQWVMLTDDALSSAREIVHLLKSEIKFAHINDETRKNQDGAKLVLDGLLGTLFKDPCKYEVSTDRN